MHRIAIFASGSGTNAENIIKYFQASLQIRVSRVFANRPDAYVIQRATRLNIPVSVFTKNEFYNSDHILKILFENEIDWIILSGFLWLVPLNILNAYHHKIINIHPALLPKYGGQGMYGHRVHEAVIHNQDPESGITIHYVNSEYDSGDTIFQATCKVLPDDTPESLAGRIHKLEYKYFPVVIEKVILGKTKKG